MGKGVGRMMKQAQRLQSVMAKVQEELVQKLVDGDAGGGMVVATANGHQEIVKIKIKREVVDPQDVEMLEDLVLAAVKQARSKSQAMAEDEMQKATAGMIPPGMMQGLGF